MRQSGKNIIKAMSPMLLILISVTLVFVTIQWRLTDQENHKITIVLNELEEKYMGANTSLNILTERYNELYSNKEGTAQEKLEQRLQTLFEMVYTYDDNEEEDSLTRRYEQAKEYATREALLELFPDNVSLIKPSVTSISNLDSLEIYIKPSNQNILEGIVFVSFTTSVSNSEPMSARVGYMFEYDQFTNQVTALKTIGTFPLSN